MQRHMPTRSFESSPGQGPRKGGTYARQMGLWLLEAHGDPSFRQLLEDADLGTLDGVPLVWMMRHLGQQAPTFLQNDGLEWPFACSRSPAGYGGVTSRTFRSL